MTENIPENHVLRKKNGVIDQRHQQIDPAGKHRVDQNESAKQTQKQPGEDPRPSRKGAQDGE